MQSEGALAGISCLYWAAPSGPGWAAEDEDFLWPKTEGGAVSSPVWHEGSCPAVFRQPPLGILR